MVANGIRGTQDNRFLPLLEESCLLYPFDRLGLSWNPLCLTLGWPFPQGLWSVGQLSLGLCTSLELPPRHLVCDFLESLWQGAIFLRL